MAEQIGLEAVFDSSAFTKGMAQYESAIKQANANTAQAASNFGKSFDSMGAKVNSLAGTIGKVLVGATGGAALALGSFAVKGIGQAVEMEKQMSTIAAIMGKTTQEVQPLSDAIVKLGLDPSLMVDATQAADAIQQLAKNGLSMTQILDGAAKSTVLLANATGANFGDAANIATGAMKLFNIDAKDMEGAVSKIVSVTTNSKFTIGDYAQALANGGGAATAAGVSFDDFNATITATSTLFAGGGDAATSFKTFISRLQPSTDAAKEAMIQLGLATKDGTSKFFDAKGQVKDMSEIAGLLQTGLKGLSDAQRSQALTTIFGADAMRTAVGLAATGKEGFAALQDQMSKTNAADQAATKMNNLAGIIEITKGAIDAVSLTIGQAFLPMLTDMAKAFSQFVSDNGPKLIEFFKTIAAVIDAFVSGTPTDFPWEDIFPPWLADIAYGVAQTIEGIGKVIADFRAGTFTMDYPWSDVFPPGVATVAAALATAVKFVSDNMTAFAGAIAGVGVVLAGAGIYSALIAIAAAIAAINLPIVALVGAAALLGAAWANDWGGIRELVMPILEGLKTAIADVAIVIQSFTSDVPGAYPWEDIFPPWLAEIMHSISFNIQGIQTVLTDFHDGILGADYDWQNVFPPETAGLAQGVYDSIQTVITIMGNLQAAFAPLTAAIATNGAGALAEIQAFATGNETEFTNVKAIWDGLTQTATNVFNGLAPIVTAALSAFKSAIAAYAPVLVSWISDKAADAMPLLSAWLGKVVAWIPTGASLLRSGMLKMATALVEWIGDNAANALPLLGTWLGKILAWIPIGVAQLATAVVKLGAALISWIASGDNNAVKQTDPEMEKFKAALLAALEKVRAGFIAGVKNFVKAWSDTMSTYDWKGLGQTIIDNVWQGVVVMKDTILSNLSAFVSNMAEKFTSYDWGALGTAILTKIGDAAVSAAGALYAKFQDIIDATKQKFTTYDWGALGQAIIDGMKAGIDKGLAALMAKVQGIADQIKQKIKDALGIGSPAKALIPIGEAIIDGLMVGLNNRQSALLSQIGGLISGITRAWSAALYSTNRPLSDFASNFSDIISLGQAWAEKNPLMPGAAAFGSNMNALDAFNQKLQDRIKLLAIIKANNLNPNSILGPGVDIADASAFEISRALSASASLLASATRMRLQQEQKEVERVYKLQGAMATFNNQLTRAADLGKASMNFFQKISFDSASKQFNDLGNEMEQVQATFIRTGDLTFQKRLNDIIAERAALLAQMQGAQDQGGTRIDTRNSLTAILNQQIALFDSAKALGWNTTGLFAQYFNNADNLSADALRKMALLQESIDQANFDALRKTLIEKGLNLDMPTDVSGVGSSIATRYNATVLDPLLEKLRSVLLLEDERTAALKEYNNALGQTKAMQDKQNQLNFLQEQLSLIDQAKQAGLSLGSVFGNMTLGANASLADLMQASSNIITGVTAKVQKSLDAVNKNRALQDAVDAKKQQLDFLNQQLDIIHQGQQAGINWEGLFAGLTVGVNATQTDILTAMQRLYDKLIKQANAELGIASPSKVFMKIGNYMAQGLGIGMQNGMGSLQSMLSTVPSSTMTNRTLNFSMGGVNVYSGLDEVMLESRIKRIMERSLN